MKPGQSLIAILQPGQNRGMSGDNLRDAVFFAIIAGMVILRAVQAMNGHRTRHVFKLNHWEFVLILCCFAVYRVLRAWGWNSVIYAWLSAFICVIVGVYSYFCQRRVNPPVSNPDDKSETN